MLASVHEKPFGFSENFQFRIVQKRMNTKKKKLYLYMVIYNDLVTFQIPQETHLI